MEGKGQGARYLARWVYLGGELPTPSFQWHPYHIFEDISSFSLQKKAVASFSVYI